MTDSVGSGARGRNPGERPMLAWLAAARTRSDFHASTLQQEPHSNINANGC